MDAPIDKHALVAEIRRRLAADLAQVSASQQATQAGATHEESRAENDKDTRALEATYLSRGLAERVVELENAVTRLATMPMRRFGEDDAVAVGALVHLAPADPDDDDAGASGDAYYILLPVAGGLRIELDGVTVRTVTTNAPIGRALVGQHLDSEVEVRTPQGRLDCVIAGLW
ncbi:GreA/GreB family elongation factor [Haliangium sp.]|uniref:GreA/GreB family elongation factor n=1 Tax=Haliangium sp. TaxID=2663208 RepID=UPI003D0A972D